MKPIKTFDEACEVLRDLAKDCGPVAQDIVEKSIAQEIGERSIKVVLDNQEIGERSIKAVLENHIAKALRADRTPGGNPDDIGMG